MENTTTKAVKNGSKSAIVLTEVGPTTNVQDFVPLHSPEQGKTITDVFEKLETLNMMKNQYFGFSEKLGNLKEFRASLDGSGILMRIENHEGKEIEFTNVKIITEFIDNAINKGLEHQANMQKEILSFSF